MLSENRFSRYLIYALGEIVLVVIGILIALQVNNWNEQRKIAQTNEVLKGKLIGELELNIERLTNLDSLMTSGGKLRGYKQLLHNTDTALLFISQSLDTTKVRWMLENPLFFFSSFNLHSSVYEEMKSTGRLYTLGSDSLIHAINKYYRRLEREEFYNNSRNERSITRIFECKYGWQMLEGDFQLRGLSALSDHSWIFDARSVPFLDLKMSLFASNATYRQARLRIGNMLSESNMLIESIRKEMKQEES